jgi:hypothetical protein
VLDKPEMLETRAMSARDIEARLLARCLAVASDQDGQAAQDQREANVFRLAAMVIQSRFVDESSLLMQASEGYFAAHPGERLAPAEVIRKGWVLSLPRLRDILTFRFSVR